MIYISISEKLKVDIELVSGPGTWKGLLERTYYLPAPNIATGEEARGFLDMMTKECDVVLEYTLEDVNHKIEVEELKIS